MSITTSARPRRLTAFLAAAAIALTGVVATAPAAEAAVAPSLTVTTNPSPAPANTLTTFTVTATAGSASAGAAIDVTMSGTPLVGTGTVTLTSAPSGWTLGFDSVARTFLLTAGQQSTKLQEGDTVSFTFTATTPNAATNLTFAVTQWANAGRTGGKSSGTPVVVPVGTVAQVITFGALGAKTFGDAPFTVSATGGASGNPVTFTATGDCTSTGTNGTTITLTGAGSCSVTANQAAAAGYTAAAPVTQSFTIGKASQTITFAAISTKTFGDGPLTLTATGGGSGNPVVFTATGPCATSGTNGTTLTLTGAGDCTVKANQAGNTNFNAAPEVERTFTIAKATATLALSGLNHTYDGNAHSATVTTTPADLTGVSVTYDGSSTAPTNAGTYTVVATLDNANYAAESATGSLVISPKALTGTFTVSNKVYDGGTSASVTNRSLVGIVGSDNVTLTGGTATFDSKNVGTRTATLSGATLSGTAAGNYSLSSVATTTGEITPLTVTGAVLSSDRTYNGSADALATTTGATLAGKIGSDDVTVSVVSASFADKNVGIDKTVTATIALAGADASNYALSSTTATDQATIWAKTVTASIVASDKVYDGSATASVTGSLTGVVAADAANVTLVIGSATFPDKNVDVDRTVTATVSISGSESGNYVLGSGTATDTATITALELTGSFTAADKVWDGTTAATITDRDLATPIEGDDIRLVGGDPATFSSPSVGTWTVTGSGFSLDGADAGNYTLASTTLTTTATINALYRGTGFYRPVDMDGIYNTIKGGQTVPLKFEMFLNVPNGAEQTSMTIFGADAAAQAAAFTVTRITCPGASVPVDAIEETVTTTGGTQFRYDATGGQYIQNWKTPTTANTCYKVSVKAIDGTTVGPAFFKVTK